MMKTSTLLASLVLGLLSPASLLAFVPSTTRVATVPRVQIPKSRSFIPNGKLVDLMPANEKGDISVIQRQSTTDSSNGENKKGILNKVSCLKGGLLN